jgi:recombination protein RecT
MSNDIQTLVYAEREHFAEVLSDKTINFEREAGYALQVLNSNEYMKKVALNNQDSLRASIQNVAAIGISLNPATKLAYLIPRKNKICLDISYMGMLHLAIDTGSICWGQAIIVRKKDIFELVGIDLPPVHKYNPFNVDRGEIVGVYVVAKTADGDYLTHSMPISAVNAIRDRSESWKAYVADDRKLCPWVTDEEEMIKKTCVKQAFKYWPKRERLSAAVDYINNEAGEGIDFVAEKAEQQAAVAVQKFYSAESFNSKKADWEKVVITGKKTASDLIIWLETKSGLSFTEEQKAIIKTWKQAIDDDFINAMERTENANS